ncbi:protein 3-oxoalanine-generating enzyme family protein [Desulfuromonas sp. DDH964]|uniref:formylglycine-generating enzyme family protein n=1 Tax=Desulfuromonas sp. DDH964 TaxID=1823759 RepID=UPI00078BECB9|nr:formylglycine-generating enzyme family protein [Desulfuromonas sp. DDH964]AMV71432.1 protein 3-oxoalanine-generating enzyme family protein [Desulfuromonas sp. DDH964]
MVKSSVALFALVFCIAQPVIAGFIPGFEPVWEKYRRAASVPASPGGGGAAYTDPATGVEFVFVKGGCFQMGSNDGEADEKPVHEVCVDDFWMGKFEVTQGQWQKVAGSNPAFFKKGDNYPVERVSWDDVQDYLRQLNAKSGKNYRLPTEAEWEYAARSGGKQEKFAGLSSDAELFRYANFCDSNCTYNWRTASQNDGYKETSPVGNYQPNGLGLYDMAGNVWEWCSDRYGDKYYAQSPRNNPRGPSGGSYRVCRGGCWDVRPAYVRSANRGGRSPGARDDDLGFRLAFPAR